MSPEPGITYQPTDELYSRVLRLSAKLQDQGRHVELEIYLATVDEAQAIFLTSAMPLTNRTIRNLLTSPNIGEFNKKLNRLPKKLFQSFISRSINR